MAKPKSEQIHKIFSLLKKKKMNSHEATCFQIALPEMLLDTF